MSRCRSPARSAGLRGVTSVTSTAPAALRWPVIVEVTPRWRAMVKQRGADWTTATVRNEILGRWIEVSGWLLYDGQHEANARNTHVGNARIWRATACEVHPVESIKVVQPPQPS